MRRHLAPSVDEDERRLRRDPKVLPQRSVIIDRVLESADSERVDEVVDRGQIIPTGHTDERNLISELLMHRYDRRGFSTTRRSPRRPEPKQNIRAFQRVEVDLSTRGSRRDELVDTSGRRRLFAATRGADERENHDERREKANHTRETTQPRR